MTILTSLFLFFNIFIRFSLLLFLDWLYYALFPLVSDFIDEVNLLFNEYFSGQFNDIVHSSDAVLLVF